MLEGEIHGIADAIIVFAFAYEARWVSGATIVFAFASVALHVFEQPLSSAQRLELEVLQRNQRRCLLCHDCQSDIHKPSMNRNTTTKQDMHVCVHVRVHVHCIT